MRILNVSAAVLAMSAGAALAAPSMETVDADHDGFASKAEILAVYPGVTDEDFASIDADNDNRLDANEMLTPAAQSVFETYASGHVTETVKSVEQIDTDHDGFASKAEMLAAYPGMTDGDFVDIDANADDRIAPDELYAASAQAILKEYEPGGTPVPEVAMFDTNHDGFASFEEIQAVYPSFEKSDFLDIDLNSDNRISQVEFNDPKGTQPMKKYL